jgi:hypothetical protein
VRRKGGMGMRREVVYLFKVVASLAGLLCFCPGGCGSDL